MTQELMAICDLTMATGGQPMVRAAYSSGKPAYGVGAGNSTMVIDETANIEEAARNTRTQQDLGLRLGLLGRRQPGRRGVDLRRASWPQLQAEGGYLANDEEKAKLEAAMWDDEGHRTIETVARRAAGGRRGRRLQHSRRPQVPDRPAGRDRQASTTSPARS